MKNQELYNRTVDILVNAYFNDTLVHGDCYACAVGNLVAANMGINLFESSRKKIYWANAQASWTFVHCCNSIGISNFNIQHYNGEAKEQIDSTGYTPYETAKIEYAFETAPKGKSEDEWMFNGLMAVIDVLDEIHENKDQTLTQQSKSKFIKQLI